LDDEFRGIRGGEQIEFGIYALCANKYGWTKRQTDEHSPKWLKKLVAVTNKHFADPIKFK